MPTACRQYLCAALTGLLLMFAPRAAQAHPHAFIDVETRVMFNAEGAVIGLREEWLFDPLYTAFALYDFDNDAPDFQDRINDLMTENLSNLGDYDLFTEIEAGGKPVTFGPPENTSTNIIDDRLIMRFTLMFDQPVTLSSSGNDAKLVYKIFDPTYYIQMRHSLDDGRIFLDNAPEGCTSKLVEPNPTTEQIFMAADLDRNAEAPEGLGRLFSEMVTITCPTGSNG